jgi:hypothetical protein
MSSDTDRLAESAAAAVSSLNRLIDSDTFTVADCDQLARIRDFVIDQAAAFTRLTQSTADIDAVMFGSPAVLEEAVKRRLTPAQLAQFAARLEK